MPAAIPLTFRIFQAGALVRELMLTQTVVKLGKVASAHVKLDDEAVSRMHAIIEVDAAGIAHVIDLGSTRGTFVNGARVHKAELQTGDVLELGDSRIELAIGESAVAVAVPKAIVEAQPQLVAAPAPTAIAKPAPPPAPVRAVAVVPPAPIARAPISTTDDRRQATASSHARRSLADAIASEPVVPGARSIEIAAMLGDSLVSVKHCSDPRAGKITAPTYALLAASALCAVTAATAFIADVRTAGRDADALAHWTHDLHKPAHSFRGEPPNGALPFGELAGVFLALSTATIGLARLRRERKSPFYRIGTASGVELATADAPAASFPLVAPSGDDFVCHFAPGMDGELTTAGTTTRIADLIATGGARTSLTVPGAVELAIPLDAKIRARSGQASFLISSVARPAEQRAPVFAIDGRFAAYAAGSLAAHLGVYALLSLGSASASAIGLDVNDHEDTAMSSRISSNEATPPPPPDPETAAGDQSQKPGGGQMKLAEGAAGDPSAQQADGHLRIAQRTDGPVGMTRAEAREVARASGILGNEQVIASAAVALGGNADFNNGFDANDVAGPLYGADGTGAGHFGGGRTGWESGGGCFGVDCSGIGTHGYATIGSGGRAGDGYRGPLGGGPGMPGHHSVDPCAGNKCIGQPQGDGDMDPAIIRRYVKRQADKISYCYEKELLAHPDLQGEVVVHFLISPTGTVQASTGNGFDSSVASCVADVIHAIQFPVPHNGGSTQVNYPFHFHLPGH